MTEAELAELERLADRARQEQAVEDVIGDYDTIWRVEWSNAAEAAVPQLIAALREARALLEETRDFAVVQKLRGAPFVHVGEAERWAWLLNRIRAALGKEEP